MHFDGVMFIVVSLSPPFFPCLFSVTIQGADIVAETRMEVVPGTPLMSGKAMA